MQPGDIIPEASSFSNFKMILFGFNMIKFSSFEMDNEAEFTVNTGKDGEAISWSVKKFKRSLKATLMIEELKHLIPLAPGGDLLKLPPAAITAESVVQGVGSLKFEIPAAKIIKYPFHFKEGDDKTEVAMEFGVISYPIISFV